MVTAIIFALVTLLAIFGFFSAIKNKNILGIIFALGTIAVFGFFSVMTIINSGYPS